MSRAIIAIILYVLGFGLISHEAGYLTALAIYLVLLAVRIENTLY